MLGRTDLGAKQAAHLLRVGNKLVLVAITPSGIKTLTEVTEESEVNRLVGMCLSRQSNSATAAFQQVFQEFAERNDSFPARSSDVLSNHTSSNRSS